MDPSRHLKVLFSRVAPEFICATAEGLGVAVAVTYREVLIAQARLFRSPLLRRYRLRDVSAIRLRRGATVSFLLVEAGGREPSTVMILYGTAAADDFERVASAIWRLSRLRRSAGQMRGRVARRHRSMVGGDNERQLSTSAMA